MKFPPTAYPYLPPKNPNDMKKVGRKEGRKEERKEERKKCLLPVATTFADGGSERFNNPPAEPEFNSRSTEL